MALLTQFLRHPMRTGAIASSSSSLAATMMEGVGIERARTVVELGPGTGVFTRAILSRLAPGSRLIAVELNPRLATNLARELHGRPVQVVNASAADLPNLVSEPVDAIVSGLPWTVMATAERDRTLRVVSRCLADRGRFTTFAYAHAAWTPPATQFAKQLSEWFTEVRRSPVVWSNLPPAFVYRAHASEDASRGGRQGRKSRRLLEANKAMRTPAGTT